MRNRQFEEDRKARRAAEFGAALERLDEKELRASHPDNPNRVSELEEIGRMRAEINEMLNEEFGLEDQYRRLIDRG